MSTTLGRPPVRSGSVRHSFWDWWIDRKTRWVRDAEKQMPDGLFRALPAGTGLPPIHQRSTFPFRSVKDGADRFLGMSRDGERPYARIYTRLGNPTTESLERVLFRLEAEHVIEKALAEDEKEPTIGCLICASGHRGDLAPDGRARHRPHRRQHILLALPSAAVPPRRGLRRPLAHEVRERPLDFRERRRPRAVPVHEGDALPLVQGPGRDAIAVRLVAELDDGAKPRGPAAGPVENRCGGRNVPEEPLVRLARRLAWLCGFPAGCSREKADARRRLDHQLRGRGRRGITQGLIRLSVGLEGADVLIDHLDRGLALAHEAS